MGKISIILTSYNKPKYVGKAIEGILNQTYQNFELFIMDDNSNEETQKIIKGYLKDRRIKFFRSNVQNDSERVEKIRYATLINEALEMIKGDYVSYATDDNVYRPKRLEIMVNYLENNPEVDIVYSSSRRIEIKSEEDFKINEKLLIADSKLWVAPCVVDHCSIMHRANVLPVIKEVWGSYWDEDPQYYLIGDARFFWRLNHFWCFYPINQVLDDNYITEASLHSKSTPMDKDSLFSKLPKQRTCKELREYLKKIIGEK